MEPLDPTSEARRQMVDVQLRRRGITNARVLAAMEAVPRHEFVLPTYRNESYADSPLPIGHDQTISQPYIVALMTQLVDPKSGDRALEVGTGSGYQAAILAHMGARVTTFEYIPELAKRARLTFERLGIDTVRVVDGDGTTGVPGTLFDFIIVTAGADNVPPSLVDQLVSGGCLVMPRGTRLQQRLIVIRHRGPEFEEEQHDACVFVPLKGSGGWQV